ncbi:MAG: hypothetical protein M3154_07555 [Candidatus Eremiobacteraeota bacterium]|nr:hypothetical protein [Candidatus Eremiobacteraeota bacterium]
MLAVDERGEIVDGDQIIAALALDLEVDAVAVTSMTNLGFHRLLAEHGIAVHTTDVGDRYVLEALAREGAVLGGEQSGHVIDLSRGTTGDGPMTAVALFSIAARTKRTLHDLASDLAVYPQVLVNVRVADKAIADHPDVRHAIAAAERELAGDGRINVRPSGTEPLVRVMVESSDRDRTHAIANMVADTVRRLG